MEGRVSFDTTCSKVDYLLHFLNAWITLKFTRLSTRLVFFPTVENWPLHVFDATADRVNERRGDFATATHIGDLINCFLTAVVNNQPRMKSRGLEAQTIFR